MTSEFARISVAGVAEFRGLGLHSGVPVVVAVGPGHDGLALSYEGERVQARPENVRQTVRSTQLGPVSTVEHLFSALAGLGVTDAEVEVDAPELPALDGSALGYVEGLLAAGLAQFGSSRITGPYARVFVDQGDAKIAIARGDGRWRYEFDAGERFPGASSAEYVMTPETYAREVAPARTFAFDFEVEPLRAAGLGRGLDGASCLVLGPEGYVNPSRFPNEPPRHKLLDLIGDLALSGVPVSCLSVVASRSGHTLNVEAASRLAAHVAIEN